MSGGHPGVPAEPDRADAGTPAPPSPRTGRTLWVGTSWKMNFTLAESAAFVDELHTAPLPEGVQPFLLPAHTALAHVRDRLPAGSPVLLGAQNAHWGPEGAGTGEVSMRMVADAGARLVEMGHSERRAAFGETDASVARKAAAALALGLVPLVCVGEPAEVRAAGEQVAFVTAQVAAALAAVPPERLPDVLVAYEPVWAIGSGGRAARVDEMAPVLASVAALLGRLGGGQAPGGLLYGGGVHPDNAVELLTDPHVDGLFVGRAGWSAAGFRAVLELAVAARR